MNIWILEVTMLRKLGKSNQIALPKKILNNLKLKENDYLDVYVEDNKIILEPKILIPKEQAYFYTKEWQIDEITAEEDIKKRRVTKTKNIEELFQKLDK